MRDGINTRVSYREHIVASKISFLYTGAPGRLQEALILLGSLHSSSLHDLAINLDGQFIGSDFYPLFHCESLRSFHVQKMEMISLDNTDLERMAFVWPNLVSLSPPFVTSLAVSDTRQLACGLADGRVWIGSGGVRVPGDKPPKKERKWRGLHPERGSYQVVAHGPIVGMCVVFACSALTS